MILTLAGRSLAVTPEVSANPWPRTHNAYNAWDCFIAMGTYRDQAITYWTRSEAILERLDGEPDHPSAGKARGRVRDLQHAMMEAQRSYLKHEFHADQVWKYMDRDEIVDEEVDQMFNMDPDQESLLGLWRHRMGSFLAPPPTCRMSNVVLQLAPVPQIRAYSKGGMR